MMKQMKNNSKLGLAFAAAAVMFAVAPGVGRAESDGEAAMQCEGTCERALDEAKRFDRLAQPGGLYEYKSKLQDSAMECFRCGAESATDSNSSSGNGRAQPAR